MYNNVSKNNNINNEKKINMNKNNIISFIFYVYLEKNKFVMYQENNRILGIYCWNNLKVSKIIVLAILLVIGEIV